MPSRAATSTAVRTALAPSTCPAVRGRPRCVAQRPFPSMMIATCMMAIDCSGTRGAPGCLDDRLDVLEIAQQGLSSENGDAIKGLWPARLEGLGAREVSRLFELARMRTQVAVAHVEQRFELVE